MTLQQLRYFLAAVKWKSFSQAASALYLSQPALSKQISLLEKALGFPLFERTPRGVTLTAKGAVFHQRIHPLLQDLDALLQEPMHWWRWWLATWYIRTSSIKKSLVTRSSGACTCLRGTCSRLRNGMRRA